MNFPKTVGFCTGIISAASFAVLLGGNAARAGDFSVESVGARWGLSSSKFGVQLMETEAFVDFNLPWRWDLGKDWNLQTKLNTSIGWFSGGGDQAAIGSVGPALQLFAPHKIPLSLEGGVSATLLSRDTFGPQDMGTLFQFTSYLGVNLDITKHLRIGYRFQHISNAGLSTHNPGINMNMVALSYVF